jgi:hypothetical protein
MAVIIVVVVLEIKIEIGPGEPLRGRDYVVRVDGENGERERVRDFGGRRKAWPESVIYNLQSNSGVER